MRDLIEFEKGQIVGARMARACHQNRWKAWFFKSNHIKDHDEIQEARKNLQQRRVKPPKLNDTDRQALKRIVERKHRTTDAKVIAESNQHLNSSVSTKAVCIMFAMSSIKPDIVEESPSRNHSYPLSTCRRVWSVVHPINGSGCVITFLYELQLYIKLEED